MTDPTPAPNPSPSPAAAASAADDHRSDPGPGSHGTWVRRFDPPSHSCPLPPLTTLGDLWRCQCGRLWAVRADIELGGRPVRRWARPRLRSRIRYANCLNYIDWQLVALAAASVAALCALAAADLFGWS